MARHTANEGPVRIQNINVWFWFMYSQKWNCAASLFPKQNCKVLSPKWNCAASFPIPTFMYLWAIYILTGSVCLFCCSQIGRPALGIQYINRSQIHEWRNWERGREVSFLGIHKLDFRYSALADSIQEGFIGENQHILSKILVFKSVFVRKLFCYCSLILLNETAVNLT